MLFCQAQVYTTMAMDTPFTTPTNSRLWLPKGTKVRAAQH